MEKDLKRIIFSLLAVMLLVGFLTIYLRDDSHLQKRRFTAVDTGRKIEYLLEKKAKELTFESTNDETLPLGVDAKSYVLADIDTGKVLIQKNGSQRLPIASLTKIMTAVVALDISNPSEYFTVSNSAANQTPTRIGVIPGQKMKLSELLNALLMTSANDAASVIQEGIDQNYGDGVFVEAMNKKAKLLGLKNTSFQNPQGFDSDTNYSTAYDLAVLSKFAIDNYPLIKQIVKKDYEFLAQDRNHKQFDLYNWNGLLDVYPNTIGIKIGNTNSALKTSIVLSNRSEKRLLAVVLGAPDLYARDLDAAALLDYGYNKTLGLTPVGVTQAMLQEKYNTWRYF